MTETTPPPAAPNLGRTIARNTAFVTLGQVLLKIFGFLFGIFVVRQLGDDQYGRYSIVIAWVGLFSIFVELGVTQYVMREIARNGSRSSELFWNLVGIRLALALIGTVAIPAGAALAGYSGEITLGVVLYTLTFIVSALQAPLDATFAANEKFGWVTALYILGQVVWLILGAAVVWYKPDFVWLIAVGIVTMLPQLATSFWVATRHRLIDWRVRISPSQWPRLIRAGLPFAVITLALTIAFSIDTVMLSWFVSDAQVGWYNIAYGLVRSIVGLLTGFSFAMVPTLARVYATNRDAVVRWHGYSTRFIALLAVPVAVGGMLIAQALVRFLYTPEVLPAAQPLALIVWDVPFLMYAATCGNLTTVIGEERAAARINVINALANIVLNAIFIPRFGILAAAAVTVSTDLIASIQFSLLLRKRLGLGLPWSTLVRVALAAAGLGVVVWLAGDQHVLVLIGIGAAAYGVLAVAFRAIGPEEWALAQRVVGAVQRRILGSSG